MTFSLFSPDESGYKKGFEDFSVHWDSNPKWTADIKLNFNKNNLMNLQSIPDSLYKKREFIDSYWKTPRLGVLTESQWV